jgi:hypothetical protein
MCHIVICVVLESTVFFHIISQTARFKKKKVAEREICVLIFSITLSEAFLIQRRIEGDLIKNVYWSLCNVQFFLSDFNET